MSQIPNILNFTITPPIPVFTEKMHIFNFMSFVTITDVKKMFNKEDEVSIEEYCIDTKRINKAAAAEGKVRVLSISG